MVRWRVACYEPVTSATMVIGNPIEQGGPTRMDSAVAASLISSSVALIVAAGGVIANARSQTRTTKATTEQALALFDRQAKTQAAAQQAEFRSRTALSHLAERRALYVEVQAQMNVRPDLLERDRENEAAMVAAADNPDETMRLLNRGVEVKGELMDMALRAAQALELVWLIAPQDVARAATALLSAVRDEDQQAIDAAHSAFMVAVRHDLGADDRAAPVAQKVAGGSRER